MVEAKRYSLVKPTVNTPFHIDFEWWQQNDREWRVHLLSCLPQEYQQAFADAGDEEVDWIDPETAEVQRVDGLQHILRIHCSLQPGYVDTHTPLVDAVFRVFLANNNKPLTPAELSARIKRPPKMILRVLAGHRVHMGLRPYVEDRGDV